MNWRTAWKPSIVALAASSLGLGLGCERGESATSDPANNPLAAVAAKAPAEPAIETVTLASNPAGAGVFLNGAELGVTPYELKFKGETRVELRLAGHVTKEVLVTPGGDPIVTATLEVDPNQQQAAADPEPAKTATKKRSRPRSRAAAAAPTPATATVPAGGTGYEVPDRRGGIAGAWDRVTGNDEDRARRHRLLARGPRYSNFRAAKKAYRDGMLSKQDYNDTVWALKTMRADEYKQAQRDVDAGRITVPQFEERRAAIQRKYEIGK